MTNLPPLVGCTRHPTLYYPDGTIVLLANITLFRVYKGILSREAEVFRRMFGGSKHLPPVGEMYDGCPLVRLQDDSDLLAYFLQALMGHIHILDDEEYTDFPLMPLAILRLSHKYEAPRHWIKAFTWFKKRIPTESEEIVKKLPLYLNFWDQFITTQSNRKEFSPDLVEIFRGCGLHRFLPWVIHMMIYSQSSLVSPKSFHSSRKLSWSFPISDETKELVSNAFDRSEHLYREEVFKVIRIYHPYCRRKCKESLRLDWLQYLTRLERPMWLWKPTFLLPDFRSLMQRQPCSACLGAWEKDCERASKEAWNKLPMICGLPDWNELCNARFPVHEEDHSFYECTTVNDEDFCKVGRICSNTTLR